MGQKMFGAIVEYEIWLLLLKMPPISFGIHITVSFLILFKVYRTLFKNLPLRTGKINFFLLPMLQCSFSHLTFEWHSQLSVRAMQNYCKVFECKFQTDFVNLAKSLASSISSSYGGK
jgi:hypothetical protein